MTQTTKRKSQPTTKDREAAKQYVTDVVVSNFGQQIDDATLDAVVEKVLRSIPPYLTREEAPA